ncbi:MAG: (2Fe-2S)-binding protein [Puniceicoccales bacterium]|jgi:NADH-quinone oxidoreductase subunit G|nr:(2Fe-2S)-binding protein [Puniceicoccales bacterium]
MCEGVVTITVDGEKVEATGGERLIEVIRRRGSFLCAPCYNKYLSETGRCGMCLVGVRRRPEDEFVVVSACTATAKDGMEIDTEHSKAVSQRNELFSLCLLKHPLDCSKCDKVGNCFLHKFSSQTRFRGFSRIVNGKLEGVEYQDFGKNIAFDGRKCIGCQRCIRFCRDILGDEVLGFIRDDDGNRDVRLYPGKILGGNYTMNLVDLCPAGALVNKNSLFQPTEWDLIRTESISTESSVGVNTYVLHKENKIFRIIPRENEHVNDAWIPDSARDEHKYFDDRKRLVYATHGNDRSRAETAIANIVKSMSDKKIAVVCSGNMSLEDQFVLRRLLDSTVSNIFFLRKSRLSDGFLISDDATPNFNGAVLTKLAVEGNVVDDLTSLNRELKDGRYGKILAINEEIFANGVSYAIPVDIEIFYIGTENEKTAKRATIAIPVATVFERTGTFINKDWRLQKFHQSINSPNGGVFPMWYVLSMLANVYTNFSENKMLWLDEVWTNMSANVELLENIDFKNIAPEGISLKTS